MADGRERRVAHASAQNQSLLASLERKRQSLAALSAGLGKSSVVKNSIRAPPAKKKKNVIHSDEDDFIEQDSAESDGEFQLTDEEDHPKRKGKKPAAKEKTPTLKIRVGGAPTNGEKARRLSESSDEGWNCKPRLLTYSSSSASGKKMQTKVSNPKPKKKVMTLSDDSEEEGENNKSNTTLKGLAKSVQREKKQNGFILSDEEFEEDGDVTDHNRESTPDSDSDAEERANRRSGVETNEERDCVEFFNTATADEFVATSKVSEKLAATIIEKRPFSSFRELETCMKQVSRGRGAVEGVLEHLENRGVLEKVLRDCRGHAAAVEKGFPRCMENLFQPGTLTEGYTLHDYQKVGLNWLIMMYEKGFNCILGDEMGLGKTIQIVSFLAWMKEQGIPGPHLVVVPSSTVENWMGEISRWCGDLRLTTYYGSQDERKQIRKMAKKGKESIDVILTTYNMISKNHDDKKFFKNFSMNYVIYDEGHMLKNCSTERYRNLMKVKGKRKILLTGTPLQNNLIELISLMYFVMTNVFTKYCEDISQLLVQFKQLGPSLENSRTSLYHKDRIEQAKLILQPYILRRLKAQVLNLPPKEEEVVEVTMVDNQNENYENILDNVRNNAGDAASWSTALIRLRQAANHPLLTRVQYDQPTLDKIAKTLCAKERAYEKKVWDHVADDLSFMGDFQIHQLCEKFRSTQKYLLDESLALQSGKCHELDKRLPNILQKGEKVLIFSQFTMMLDILEVYMKVRGYRFLRLDGQTPVLERQELINEFNTDSEVSVFLLSTRAGGLGINLTSANHIIIHDIDFNPYNDKQAEDRCHRMGQKRTVYVTRLISKGSVETGIYSLARRKLQLEKQVTVGIKGQLEDDDESTRDSADSDDKMDTQAMQNILKDAMDHKVLN